MWLGVRIKPEDACAGLLVVEHERSRDGGAERRREGEIEGAATEPVGKDKGEGTRVEILQCFRLDGVLSGIKDRRL